MGNTSSSRASRVNPRPIGRFCEKVLSLYKPTPEKRDYTTYYRIVRVTTFLNQHPSVKTTNDIVAGLIPEFAAACSDLSESTRITTMKHFRHICNLAIEWKYLKRNPFEGYPFPQSPSRSFARDSRGRKLDCDQIRDVLALMKSRMDTWKEHRLYAFTAVVVYAGLLPTEVRELKLADCDLALGVIKIRRRAKFLWSVNHPVVHMPPILTEILSGWFPRRLQRVPPRLLLKYPLRNEVNGPGRGPARTGRTV